MSNPALDFLGGGAPYLQQGDAQAQEIANRARQMMQRMKAVSNTQIMMQQVLQQNPQIGQVLATAKNPGDLKMLACNMAQQLGISPQKLEAALKA